MASPIFVRPTEEDREVDWIKKRLFKSAMKGKWDDVVKIYQEIPEARRTKITRSGDTALHIAVSHSKESIVLKFVELIKEWKRTKCEHPLKIVNEKGNTPLHLAASVGHVQMCLCIAEENRELMGIRNNEGETPLFPAALHGKKGAFLCLHHLYGGEIRYDHCRRGNGQTILHCAISEEYFDLAYQIARMYQDLINSVDEQGRTPLHLLASKPASFKSGSRLNWLNKIVYHCLFVEKLKEESDLCHYSHQSTVEDNWGRERYPKNYKTCMNFFRMLVMLWHILLPVHCRKYSRPSDQKDDLENPETEHSDAPQKLMFPRVTGMQEKRLFPPNYHSCYKGFEIIKYVSKALVIILGVGFTGIRRLQEKKQKHLWAIQIMDELLSYSSLYEYEDGARDIPEQSSVMMDAETKPYRILDGDVTFDKDAVLESQSLLEGKRKMEKQETPILIAAKNGIAEMVDRILELFPVAIHDVDHQKKNIVLLAVEHRQPHVYILLLREVVLKDTAFRHVDVDGNSALHLVAKLGDSGAYPFAALQMQWELKWYQLVRKSATRKYFVRYNKEGKTAKEIFTESHQELASKGGEWLNNISNSCSVVATLVAAVSFATTATAPGGIKEDSSKPTFDRHPGFLIYAVSSLIALVFSVTSMVTFLAILTARRKMEDFERRLPRKLLLGLTCLFISIGAMLVCFCGAHFFLLKDVLEDNAFTVYALACLPTTIFAVAQFPFYFVLLRSTFLLVPHRYFP